MDNPLKKRPLAIECTRALKKSPCGWVVQGGRGKGGRPSGGNHADLVASSVWSKSGPPLRRHFLPREGNSWAGLGRGAEEKLGCAVAVSIKESLKKRPPLPLWPPAKGDKVARRFLPGGCPLRCAYGAEIAKPNEHSMSAAKPLQNDSQPAGYQPGGHKAFRIQRHHGAKEALAPHLPILKAQQEGGDHRHHRVLEVGDQLDRKKGEGSLVLAAEKPRNGDQLFFELREQINGMAPIRVDLPIAVQSAADRADRSNGSGKIDTAGKKRFLVFQKGLEFVNVGQLDFSVPRSQGGRLWASQTFGPASLLGVVSLRRSIPYLANPLTVPSPVRIPHKFPSPYTHHIAGDNTHCPALPLSRPPSSPSTVKHCPYSGTHATPSRASRTMD